MGASSLPAFSGLSLQPLLPFIALLLAFVLGSIPFGLLIARIFKVEGLREKGSGNIGATNMTRVAGFWPAGFLTFALDAGKGALAVFLIWQTGIQVWLGSALGFPVQFHEAFAWAMGLFAVLGHCFTPWLLLKGGKGGKGVATGLGAILVLAPVPGLCGIIAFALTFLYSRISSLSSLVGLLLVAIAYLVLNPIGVQVWLGGAILFVILYRHEANIDALLENRENAFH